MTFNMSFGFDHKVCVKFFIKKSYINFYFTILFEWISAEKITYKTNFPNYF